MTTKMRTRSTKHNEIAQLVDWGCEQCHKVSESPRLDAEILLTHVINKPRSYCRTWPDKTLTKDTIKRYEDLIALRLKPTPIAYLIGFKEFWSRDFLVSPDTLIPRPETELLVEHALDFLNLNKNHMSVLDLGTGSGCIAITLKKEQPSSDVTAADISIKALSIAQKNAKTHLAEVNFIASYWFNAIQQESFDLIVSNPPYISLNDAHLHQGDLPAEPLSALASGEDGLNDIRLLTTQAKFYLKRGGMLMIEHGYDQKKAVFDLFKQHGYQDIQQYDDLGQQARLTSGLR